MTRSAPLRARIQLILPIFRVLLLVLSIGPVPESFADEGDSAPLDLEKYERKVFSQFGEDGVIEKIFEIIEPTSRYCVEFGASDGIVDSNMRNLVVNHGWSSFQIEGDPSLARKLVENYADYPRVKTLQAWVWPGNIEVLFEENGVPEDLDLLVIDIDSNDYYVWRALRQFRPKVVMIETNPFFPPPQLMVIDYHPMNYWDGSAYFGASPQSMYKLGKEKGYELVYHVSDGANIIFVDEKYYSRFGVEDNSPARLIKPFSKELADLFRKGGGLDGEPFRKPELIWKNLKIEKKFIYDR